MSKQTTILLVEDSKLCVHAMKNVIEHKASTPVNLLHAQTMQNALSTLKDSAGNIDLILLDLGLPDTSSDEESFTKIKSAAPNTPIVVLTGRHDHDFANHIVMDGAQDYVNKDEVSANPKLLINAIDFALSRHRNQEKVVEKLQQKEQVISWMSGQYSGTA
ncbi:MAG: response regulator [Alphaproteobacteria bacterium]|nr:response regulator [Alphaproteobacteria bacterium]